MSSKKKKPGSKPTKERKIEEIPLAQIRIPDERITSVTPEGIFKELKESVAKRGILQPLQVLKIGKELILVDGLHRMFAAQQLGLPTVPCIVREGTEETLLVENLIVNRQRGKSDPVGEGTVLRALVREHGMTITAACRAVALSPTWGKKLYNIVALPQNILEAIRHESLSVGSAEHLLALDDPVKRDEVAADAIRWNYTVEQTKARVLELLNPDHDKPAGGYEFTETGQPQKILPECFACGQEIQDRLKYAYFHPECFDDIQNILTAEEFKGYLEPPEIKQRQPEPPPTPYRLQSNIPPQPSQQPPQQYGFVQPVSQYQAQQQPQQPTGTVNMQQLQCRHSFQQVGPGQLQCSLCLLTVSY